MSQTHASLAAIVSLLLATTVAAQAARPDTRTMTCDQVHRLLDSRGAVVMTTGTHTYDRFIGGGGQCFRPEEPTMTSVRAKDTRNCPVYKCETPRDDFFRDRMWRR